MGILVVEILFLVLWLIATVALFSTYLKMIKGRGFIKNKKSFEQPIFSFLRFFMLVTIQIISLIFTFSLFMRLDFSFLRFSLMVLLGIITVLIDASIGNLVEYRGNLSWIDWKILKLIER